MSTFRGKLIEKIIKKKLYEEIEQIIQITRQGFDVHAQIEFFEVEEVLKNLMQEELNVNSRLFQIISSKEELLITPNEQEVFMPTILIGNHKLNSGLGFVRYIVKTPDQLLSSVASAADIILEHFGLGVYIDCFDAQILNALKRVSRMYGLSFLIDCVVQTAYFAGYKGDVNLALNYLNNTELVTNLNKGNEFSVEKCAKIYLNHVSNFGENAHTFLKSSLSYFMVSDQGHSMTRASQLLSISRTTMQEHLKIANELGMSSFFDGSISR